MKKAELSLSGLDQCTRDWIHDASGVLAKLDLMAGMLGESLPELIAEYQKNHPDAPENLRLSGELLAACSDAPEMLHRMADKLRQSCNHAWEVMAEVNENPALLDNKVRLRAESMEGTPAPGPRRPDSAAKALGIGKNALVVDDEILMREVISDMLEDRGFNVDIAEHGAQAWEKIQKNHYGLVLLDFRMPVMHGFELTEKVLSRKNTANPVLIGMTNTPAKDEHETGRSIGMAEVMVKPITGEALDNVLRRFQPT